MDAVTLYPDTQPRCQLRDCHSLPCPEHRTTPKPIWIPPEKLPWSQDSCLARSGPLWGAKGLPIAGSCRSTEVWFLYSDEGLFWSGIPASQLRVGFAVAVVVTVFQADLSLYYIMPSQSLSSSPYACGSQVQCTKVTRIVSDYPYGCKTTKEQFFKI